MEDIRYDVAPARTNRRIFPPDASIILVGCHGAGKRTLGFIAAKYLGRRLLTEDRSFEQSTGCNRPTFLQKYGRDAFNKQVMVVLAETLESNRHSCVIECGMSTLSGDSQGILSAYTETNPIIYVHRDKEDIYKLLNMPVADAERLLIADQGHRVFSNLEYFNLLDASGDGPVTDDSSFRSASTGSARLIKAKQDFIHFLDHISGHGLTRSWVENPFSINAIPPEYRTHTFVLNLRLSVLMNMGTDLTQLEASAEAVELIIDTWPSNILDFIASRVALIRRQLDVPIIYHVEENPREERRRTLDERDSMDLKLMIHGLRLGVDYLSLDLERSEQVVSQVLTMRGRTKIIGNYVIRGFGAPQWTDDVYVQRYLRGKTLGCHIVRIARFSATERSDELHAAFVGKVQTLPDPKPHLIAFDFSVFGVVSPLQGISMNPSGHDALEKSAREQMVGVTTARGTLRVFFRRGWLQPLNFYTLGSNVYYSASPSMHRAAYEHYMMPHTFDAKRCDSMEELDRIRSEPGFGGASLTAPFKVAIMKRLDHLSSHATAIGAVNTLLPLRGKTASILDHANARNQAGSTNKFYGDNTDWSSIVTCLRRAVSPRNSVQPSRTTALVVGAGGMARAAIYALIKLGCRKIFIFNRTISKADEVATHFNAYAKELRLVGRKSGQEHICYVISSARDPWPEGYQQPTLILSCIPASGTDNNPPVDFRMPSQWLKSPTGGVVIELAYEPLVTPLVVQMRNLRDNGNSSWVIVDGLEVVGEMAMEAFELMTGRKAPRILMRRVCNETWEKQCAPFQPQR
ncbi:Uu.00g047110.m01.CDS01 [Anthostomella pinea]|uniref:Uu.00g047110.m01.CDS01 n=1 Tax=Anthostomella pinea TaxID=933095 RepID=A0AAI8YEP7_9PEZI|nr:Uu.00g047110.m01.CDS01 [Anthostomella pinea]